MGVAIPQVVTEDRASGAQVIDGSLKFDNASSTYLSRTPSSPGNRKTFTLSFWVKSSVAQTFGIGLAHEDGGGNYGVSYTVNSADTWEYKTLTFNGNTSTAINNDNGRGIRVSFALAAGSDNVDGSDATAWSASGSSFGQHSNTWVGTVGNTWQITGVQLEVGSVATPFEHRSYGDELFRCYRYYYKYAIDANSRYFNFARAFSSTNALTIIHFPVALRTRPTALEQSGTAAHYKINDPAVTDITCSAVPNYDGQTSVNAGVVGLTVSSGLTAKTVYWLMGVNADAYLAWSAEL